MILPMLGKFDRDISKGWKGKEAELAWAAT
jgi:hypothetical protein